MNAVANRVAALRRRHEHSLREAAARTGVSHTTIARIEQGIVVGSFSSTLKKIADGYSIPLSELLSPDEAVAFATTEHFGLEAYFPVMHKAQAGGVQVDQLERMVDAMVEKTQAAAGQR